MTGRRELYALTIVLVAMSAAPRGVPCARAAGQESLRSPGLYAHVRTTEGSFTFKLLENEAPKNVANFAGLAEGTIDPATGKPGKGPHFYDGLTFHRAVKGFIIQGGDPNGDGTGGPGYRIADELLAKRPFDRAGLVAMASHAPNQNGSQFFITLAPAPTLDGKFTIVGEVVQGMDVIRKIAGARTTVLPGDRLVPPVRIESVRIERVTE